MFWETLSEYDKIYWNWFIILPNGLNCHFIEIKSFTYSFLRVISCLFINEAIISTSMYATIKAGGPTQSQRVRYKPDLMEESQFLSSLLKNEFVYGAAGLQSNLDQALEEMVIHGVLSSESQDGITTGQGSMDWISLSPEERRIGRENFDFYCFLLWPFIETYWLAAVSLFSLSSDGASNGWIDERILLNRCQFFGMTLYYEGIVFGIYFLDRRPFLF
jgi:hypothetical protein